MKWYENNAPLNSSFLKGNHGIALSCSSKNIQKNLFEEKNRAGQAGSNLTSVHLENLSVKWVSYCKRFAYLTQKYYSLYNLNNLKVWAFREGVKLLEVTYLFSQHD